MINDYWKMKLGTDHQLQRQGKLAQHRTPALSSSSRGCLKTRSNNLLSLLTTVFHNLVVIVTFPLRYLSDNLIICNNEQAVDLKVETLKLVKLPPPRRRLRRETSSVFTFFYRSECIYRGDRGVAQLLNRAGSTCHPMHGYD